MRANGNRKFNIQFNPGVFEWIIKHPNGHELFPIYVFFFFVLWFVGVIVFVDKSMEKWACFSRMCKDLELRGWILIRLLSTNQIQGLNCLILLCFLFDKNAICLSFSCDSHISGINNCHGEAYGFFLFWLRPV